MSTRDSQPERPLSAGEAREFAQELAQVVGSQAPLDVTLRAAAAETPGAVGRALGEMARRVERGESIESAVARQGYSLPPPLHAVLALAAREGGLQRALGLWAEEQRRLDDLRNETRGAVAYPLFILVLSIFLTALCATTVGGVVVSYVEMFGVTGNWQVRSAAAMARSGPWLLFSLFACIILLPLLRLALGRDMWSSIATTLPIVGPLWRWSAMARWSRWLALLVDARMPLVESLPLAAAAAGDSQLQRETQRLRNSLLAGGSLSRSMADGPLWPASATVLVGWGERSNSLSASLRSIADLCEARVRLRSRWTRMALPPLAFVGVIVAIVFAYTLLIVPMITMLDGMI